MPHNGVDRLRKQVAKREPVQPLTHFFPFQSVTRQVEDFFLDLLGTLLQVLTLPIAPKQHPVDFVVELFQQRGLPGAPGPRTGRQGIRHRQQEEHFQAFPVAGGDRTVQNRLFIHEVAFEGGFSKDEMVFHQKAEQSRLLEIETKAPRYLLHQRNPPKRVVFTLPLAEIVDQSRQVEDAPMLQGREKAAQAHSAQPLVFVVLHPMQLADGAQQVLVHGIEVVHIVLDAKAHRNEFRQKSFQKPRFQHHLKHGKGPFRVQQNIEKPLNDLRVLPGRFGESPEILANNPTRLMMEMGIHLRRLPEELHEQARVLA